VFAEVMRAALALAAMSRPTCRASIPICRRSPVVAKS
jgi:hypothetical protein